MRVQDLIKRKPYLLWHTNNYRNLSDEAAVEAVLNYGDFDDVKKLMTILGMKKAAAIFRKQASRRRRNYDPKTAHYFKLFFAKYA